MIWRTTEKFWNIDDMILQKCTAERNEAAGISPTIVTRENQQLQWAWLYKAHRTTQFAQSYIWNVIFSITTQLSWYTVQCTLQDIIYELYFYAVQNCTNNYLNTLYARFQLPFQLNIRNFKQITNQVIRNAGMNK